MARRPKGPDARTGVGHLIDLFNQTVPPIHPRGIPFVAAPAAVAVLGRSKPWISRPAMALAGASALFFRHPSRVPPTGAGLVVAPADGTIAIVDEMVPHPELGLGDQPLPRICTFLSVFDVHVQRVPIAGRVLSVVHKPGEFLSADLPEASTANERTSMTIATPEGPQVGVVQIAGLIARRIVNDAEVGHDLVLGDTYGLIRFGSRVDVFLPAGTVPKVSVGQRAIGAETVFADLS
ncbi:phosphatidylserine decarboxylase [Gordonia malaquae]|uniref:Phosphatidylserine decarboxylase proenzyme n=1 Tax=Gordonia malaquae NBRC 108250 TaxID=1223542 RepID=M3UXN4_GORML|nr:phosphatidylserine decarboxylase [Gordonia malaquae]GAC80527.1 phosphatidylserine decarboxylase proenzyme [Gordonia malaquae NBRC 108250]SEE17930.1 phosphatidylserine decarboxylase [Gordonia malaquae]